MSTTCIGSTWPSELEVTKDPVSGATVRKLTNYMAHSHHNYFTYPGWYDEGRKLVIVSERGNHSNFYGVDLDSGEMTRLTDFGPGEQAGNFCKNPKREEIYYRSRRMLNALDLTTLQTRPVFEFPEGYVGGGGDVTADGRFIVIGAHEDLSDRFQVDLLNGYIGFNEMWAAKPHSIIWKIPLAGGEPQPVHEDHYWLGHFNASPKLANIMTFCHEGPWNKVDNRIWGLNHETGECWKIRPTDPGEHLGHEYWMSDGEHIGYHGFDANGGFYGAIRYDNTDLSEGPFDGHCWHFHSHMLELVIGDGDAKEAYLLAWRFRDGVFEGPKVLAWHRGSFHTQQLHVHPHVFAGGSRVLYTADPQGYGQVFSVEVPAWDDMPDRAEVTRSKEV